MKNLIPIILCFFLLCNCSQENRLIQNQKRLNDIDKMLKIQQDLTSKSTLPIWSILEKATSENELQAIKFLYAYMPLSDLADYSPEFMLANIQSSLLAKKEMPWGNLIPEEEFLHFVLPVRVNNENLDSFRLVYYEEIKNRVKGLTMQKAALEINHWCHEKVNYRGTDSRTSAPMSTIRKTFGRCGEESTFTVASMRMAGIPARQVYTPRWAHTDDNHAWVEVWIDGKWHYLGACEPEAELDRGWFSEPAQRTMLVHTRTYGRYFGPEEVLNAEDRFSELNLTANYAKTKKITIQVLNQGEQPLEGAKVEFKLYNYAEFYPIATTTTDQKGYTNLTTGLGDLLVWASKEAEFAYKQIKVANTDTLKLVIKSSKTNLPSEYYDLTPPKASKTMAAIGDSQKRENDKRLAFEDSIRNSYLASFKDSAWIRQYAKEHAIAMDTLMKVVRLSYGNWREILSYIESTPSSMRSKVFALTEGISGKDLSDTKAGVLSDHLNQTMLSANPAITSSPFFEKYVLAPRIDLEILSPWRSFLGKNFGNDMAEATRKNINILTDWMNSNIRVDAMANKHSRAPLTPIGVYNLRVADPVSRDIFFVAACRTFGIPARLNPETHVPEYIKGDTWLQAGFESIKEQPESGELYLIDKNNNLTPQYSLHFTIARIHGGVCHTLEFEEGKRLTDFPNPMKLEIGDYLLVTGKRLSDGSVLSSLSFFNISVKKPVSIEVTLRNETTLSRSYGKISPEKINLMETGNQKEVPLNTLMQNENSILVLMDPESEPSKHILNDLAPYVDQYNSLNMNFIFVTTPGKRSVGNIFRNYKTPVRSQFTADIKDELAKAFTALTGRQLSDILPVVVFCRPSGEIPMISEGYKIGIGEQVLQVISREETKSGKPATTKCTTP